MRKATLLLLILSFLFLSGCAMIKQGIQDYKTGKETPVAVDETSPAQLADNIVDTIKGLPYIGPFAGSIGSALTGFLVWRRGRKIRLGMPLNTKPATGFLGNLIGAEGLVQTVSNVLTGAFEVGGENSALKRAWKVFLATGIGLAGLAASVPAFQDFAVSHPALAASIAGLSSLFAGLEKALSKVQPVAQPNS